MLALCREGYILNKGPKGLEVFGFHLSGELWYLYELPEFHLVPRLPKLFKFSDDWFD